MVDMERLVCRTTRQIDGASEKATYVCLSQREVMNCRALAVEAGRGDLSFVSVYEFIHMWRHWHSLRRVWGTVVVDHLVWEKSQPAEVGVMRGIVAEIERRERGE